VLTTPYTPLAPLKGGITSPNSTILPSGEGRINAYKMLGGRLLRVIGLQEHDFIEVITAVEAKTVWG